MKATLEFNMAIDSEDRSEFNAAVNGMGFALTCWDLSEAIRGWLKYEHDFKTANNALEGVQRKLRETMEYYSVSHEMIE